jgi:hypothetical protein
LQILDISDPRRVRLKGTYVSPGTKAVAIAGSSAYLAKGGGGLEMLDISTPTNVIWMARTTPIGPAEDVVVLGNQALVAVGEAGLQTFEIRQSLSPPLKPPTIADGMIALSWPALDGVLLQQASSLTTGDWQDVSGSKTKVTITLPLESAMKSFRLVRP